MNLLPAIGGSCSANQLNDCYLINDHSTERRGGHLERKIWEGGGGEQYPNYKVNKKKIVQNISLFAKSLATICHVEGNGRSSFSPRHQFFFGN